MAFRFRLQEPACDADFLSLVDGETLFNAKDPQVEAVKSGTIAQLGWHPICLPMEWFLTSLAHTTVKRVMENLQCTIQYLHHEREVSARKKAKALTLAKQFADERDSAFEELVELRESEAMLRKRLLANGEPTRALRETAVNKEGVAAAKPFKRTDGLVCRLCGNEYPTTGALQSHYRKRHKRSERYAALAATSAAVNVKQQERSNVPMLNVAQKEGKSSASSFHHDEHHGARVEAPPPQHQFDTSRENLALRSELLDVRLAVAKLVESHRTQQDALSPTHSVAVCGALPGTTPWVDSPVPSVYPGVAPGAATFTLLPAHQPLRQGPKEPQNADGEIVQLKGSLEEANRRLSLLEGIITAQAAAMAGNTVTVASGGLATAGSSGASEGRVAIAQAELGVSDTAGVWRPRSLSTNALTDAYLDIAVSPMTQPSSPSVRRSATPSVAAQSMSQQPFATASASTLARPVAAVAPSQSPGVPANKCLASQSMLRPPPAAPANVTGSGAESECFSELPSWAEFAETPSSTLQPEPTAAKQQLLPQPQAAAAAATGFTPYQGSPGGPSHDGEYPHLTASGGDRGAAYAGVRTTAFPAAEHAQLPSVLIPDPKPARKQSTSSSKAGSPLVAAQGQTQTGQATGSTTATRRNHHKRGSRSASRSTSSEGTPPSPPPPQPAAAAEAPSTSAFNDYERSRVPGETTAAARQSSLLVLTDSHKARTKAAAIAAAVMKKPKQWVLFFKRRSEKREREVRDLSRSYIPPPVSAARIGTSESAASSGGHRHRRCSHHRSNLHMDPTKCSRENQELPSGSPQPAIEVEDRLDHSRDSRESDSMTRSIPKLRLVSEMPSPTPSLARESYAHAGSGYPYPDSNTIIPVLLCEAPAVTPPADAELESVLHEEEDVVNLASSSLSSSAEGTPVTMGLRKDSGREAAVPVTDSGRRGVTPTSGGRRSIRKGIAIPGFSSRDSTALQNANVPSSAGHCTPSPAPSFDREREHRSPLATRGRKVLASDVSTAQKSGINENSCSRDGQAVAGQTAPATDTSGKKKVTQGAADAPTTSTATSTSYEYYYSVNSSDEKIASGNSSARAPKRIQASPQPHAVSDSTESLIVRAARVVKPPSFRLMGPSRPPSAATPSGPPTAVKSQPLILKSGAGLKLGGAAKRAKKESAPASGVTATKTSALPPLKGESVQAKVARSRSDAVEGENNDADGSSEGGYYSYSYYTTDDSEKEDTPTAARGGRKDSESDEDEESASSRSNSSYSYYDSSSTTPRDTGHTTSALPLYTDPDGGHRADLQHHSRIRSGALSAVPKSATSAQSEISPDHIIDTSKKMMKRFFSGLKRWKQ